MYTTRHWQEKAAAAVEEKKQQQKIVNREMFVQKNK